MARGKKTSNKTYINDKNIHLLNEWAMKLYKSNGSYSSTYKDYSELFGLTLEGFFDKMLSRDFTEDDFNICHEFRETHKHYVSGKRLYTENCIDMCEASLKVATEHFRLEFRKKFKETGKIPDMSYLYFSIRDLLIWDVIPEEPEEFIEALMKQLINEVNRGK